MNIICPVCGYQNTNTNVEIQEEGQYTVHCQNPNAADHDFDINVSIQQPNESKEDFEDRL